MMFRRLYWVAEQLDGKGGSIVTGVYTSIQDLVNTGLHWCDDTSGDRALRLTLVKPDSFNCPLAKLESADFASIEERLQPFVGTNEYTAEEVMMLRDHLNQFLTGAAAA